MVASDRPPRNAFVKTMRKVYNPIGFKKGYNAILWFIFSGALFGFVLARFEYLNFRGIFCSAPGTEQASPGECFWYLNYTRYEVGIQLHLYTCLPAGLLALFQFIPVIRYKAILYHRIAGYLIILLMIASHAGALMIADKAFGGGLDVQMYVGVLAIISLLGFFMAIWNIKKLQIDQHRAWMLRTWFYLGTIITSRLILILTAIITPGNIYEAMPCDKLLETFGNVQSSAYEAFPNCNPNNATAYAINGGFAVVQAKFNGGNVAQLTAALNASFGPALWLALVLHAIGIEVYLHLTPAESDRLRQVSYERQLERGWKDAGYSGLVPQKIGDANPWVPAMAAAEKAPLKRPGAVTGSSDDTITMGQQTNRFQTIPKTAADSDDDERRSS